LPDVAGGGVHRNQAAIGEADRPCHGAFLHLRNGDARCGSRWDCRRRCRPEKRVRCAPEIFRDAIDGRSTGQRSVRLSPYAVGDDSETELFIGKPEILIVHANEAAMAYAADFKRALGGSALSSRLLSLAVQRNAHAQSVQAGEGQ